MKKENVRSWKNDKRLDVWYVYNLFLTTPRIVAENSIKSSIWREIEYANGITSILLGERNTWIHIKFRTNGMMMHVPCYKLLLTYFVSSRVLS